MNMKKEYIKPTLHLYNIKMTQILCVSGDIPLAAPELDERLDLPEFEQLTIDEGESLL